MPGHGLDLAATAMLVVLAVVMLALAAWAFSARDYAAPLWVRPRYAVGGVQGRPATRAADRIPQRMLGSVAAASVRRGWVGMVVWAGCVGGLHRDVRRPAADR